MLRRRWLLTALLAAAACSSPSGRPVAPAVGESAPGDELPRYFILEHGSGAELLHLGHGGTYRVVAREHMGLFVQDSGRWKSAAGGAVLLCSDHEFRRIEHGSLTVHVPSEDAFQELPRLRDEIVAYLRDHQSPTLPPSEVQRIGSGGDGDRISWMPLAKAVPRGDLEGLHLALVRYLGASDQNLFRRRLERYRDVLFLSSHHNDRELVQRAVDAGEPPMLVWLPLDPARFAKESSHTQPFVFYPAMNRCTGCSGAPPVIENRGPALDSPRCGSPFSASTGDGSG